MAGGSKILPGKGRAAATPELVEGGVVEGDFLSRNAQSKAPSTMLRMVPLPRWWRIW